MSEFTFELNNARKFVPDNKITRKSNIVEIFSLMAAGKDLNKFNAKTANDGVAYINNLYKKAAENDTDAVCQLNTIRQYAIESKLLEEIRLPLSLFGNYKPLGYNESIEREVYKHIGDKSRFQAANGDVTFPAIKKEKYSVTSQIVSGGFMYDYRAEAMNAMEKENEGIEQVRIDIRNNAAGYCVKKLYNTIKNATGVKYWSEAAGITQTSLDTIMQKVRPFGRPAILGSFAAVAQINKFAVYSNGAASSPITGVSEAVMEEIRKNGLLFWYNGSPVHEIPNSPNMTKTTTYSIDSGTLNTYQMFIPEGLLAVVPTGVQSPIMTWTRGGLTSMTGADPYLGLNIQRFDLEIAMDLPEDEAYKIGLMNDTNLSAATVYAY